MGKKGSDRVRRHVPVLLNLAIKVLKEIAENGAEDCVFLKQVSQQYNGLLKIAKNIELLDFMEFEPLPNGIENMEIPERNVEIKKAVRRRTRREKRYEETGGLR